MEQPQGAALLPYDQLEDVLARLPPRDLAIARGVCRAWRAVIDGSRLLRVDLLPFSLGGIFIAFNLHIFPEYFSNPLTSPTISSMLDYLPWMRRIDITSHCNGLLLLHGEYVVNPATRWWEQLPPPSQPLTESFFYYWNHLVFDPTLSSHYEVFSVPRLYGNFVTGKLNPVIEKSEWPPSSCILHVFSSRANGWEGRSFARDREAAGTVSDIQNNNSPLCSVYYRGVLYVQCENDFVMRISLSDSKYQAIKPPLGIDGLHLGKSENGVYFASLDYYPRCGEGCLLRIWILNESCGQAEWLLKYHANLKCALHENLDLLARGLWVLQDVNYNFHRDLISNDEKEAQMGEKYKWGSHNDYGSLTILGFHPFKEIVFLSQSLKWGLAYHLNSSKVQYLGYLYPTEYEYFGEMGKEIMASYPYTPCWM